MASWRSTFDALEASAGRGNADAAAACEWIGKTLRDCFDESPVKLNGGDPCERVAEALAVWLKESDESRFDAMRGQRFSVSSVDDSAEGMERLRDQSEFILLAYPGEGAKPAELTEQWSADLDSVGRPDGFGFALAESVIRDYCEERGDYLAAILAERSSAMREERLAAINADDSGDDVPEESEWPPIRLYVSDESESGE